MTPFRPALSQGAALLARDEGIVRTLERYRATGPVRLGSTIKLHMLVTPFFRDGCWLGAVREIAAFSPRSAGLREVALPHLEYLYEATHENVQLAVLDGIEAVYVERLCGRGAIKAISRVGGRLPLHATGVGLVLLAYSDHEFQERVLAAPLRRFGTKTITSPWHLRRVLAVVRQERVAVSDRQIEMETLSVAAPVFGPSDRVVAALSIVISARRSPSAYIPAVRIAARSVSRGPVWG